MARLVIPGRLPGLNEYTAACRTHPQAGAKMKKEAEEKVLVYIMQQLQGMKIVKPVKIEFIWVEKDMRRDPDNISGFGRKVILDALVRTGILQDDSRKYVISFEDSFSVDKANPRIEVKIEEVK